MLHGTAQVQMSAMGRTPSFEFAHVYRLMQLILLGGDPDATIYIDGLSRDV